MTPMLLAAFATSFLLPARLAPSSVATSSNTHSIHSSSHAHVSRTTQLSSLRARAPVAFDAGFDMSDGELKLLLNARGIEYDDNISRDEMLAMLERETLRVDHESVPAADLSPAEAERVEVFERVAPAVAYIQTIVSRPSPLSLNSPFQWRATEQRAGAGSGFVWDADGHIITNAHVITGGPVGVRGDNERDLPRTVRVTLQNWPEELEATVVGMELDKDIAVLKIDPAALANVTPLEAGSSGALKVGQSALAVGNPFGLDWTLTTGIVSALGRDIDGAGGRPIRDCIQHDAAINPGNSGGPLLDSRGKLIGVNTMIYSPNGIGANVGIGFAVPVDTVRRVVTQIIERGDNARPSIGVAVVSDQVRKQYARNLRRKLDGALVAEVVPGSPAHKKLAPCERRGAGVLLGDMITAVNGASVANNEDLLCAVEESEPDEPVVLTVLRGSDPEREEEVVVTPVPRKELESSSR